MRTPHLLIVLAHRATVSGTKPLGIALLLGIIVFALGCYILPHEARQMSTDIYDIKLSVQRIQTIQNDSQKTLDTSLQALQQKSASNFDILNSNIIDLDQRLRAIEEELATLRGRIEEMKFQLSSQLAAASMSKSLSSPPLNTDTTVTTQGTVIDGDLLLRNAQHDFDRGNYAQTIQQCRQFLSLFPRSFNASSAQLLLGDSLYFQGNYELALQEFLRVKDNYPADARVPDALQKAALCYLNLNQKDQAVSTLKTIINQFPQYADLARVKHMLSDLTE